MKLVGSAQAGDIIVPSGRGDGTGVAVCSCRALFMMTRIGTAEVDLHESDSTQPEGGSPQEIELLSLGKRNKGQSWQYVDCNIVSPSLSHGRDFPIHIVCWTVLGLLLIGGAWFFAVAPSEQGDMRLSCKRIELAHGNVSGSCDGHAGGTCEYTTCDFGYSLAPSSQGSVETEVSAEAANPPGGCLNRGSDWQHFPPCTTCFGDGLMCEPKNRTYPLPLPPPPPQVNGLFGDQTVWPAYQYSCPSSTEELQSCEPQGRLCFGPYNGFPPCEYCSAARDGAGLACEASSRYVRWGLRDDLEDNWVCLSSADPQRSYRMTNAQGFYYSNWKGSEWCKCHSPSAGSSFVPPSANGCLVTADTLDIVRTAKFCVQIDGLPDRKHLPDATTRGVSTMACSSSRSATPSIATSAKRHCSTHGTVGGQLATYDGTEMHCARLYCPAERLGALRMGACRFCEGKEAFVSIPR